jgi:predicted ArsR family transcriptional regulator
MPMTWSELAGDGSVDGAGGSVVGGTRVFYPSTPCKIVAVARRLAAEAQRAEPSDTGEGRLALLKALGDNTRYAIYLELARSPRPRSTGEIAEALDLHPNTVRPHLERMRDVGLVRYESHSSGVGRPQHRYFLAPDAPALGLEAPSFPMLAAMLAATARAAGACPDDAIEIGREQGRADADRHDRGGGGGAPRGGAGRARGFDPAVAIGADDAASVAFAHCPFGDVAAEHPDLVCALHRGMVEGLVESCGGSTVTEFNTFADRPACRAVVCGR